MKERSITVSFDLSCVHCAYNLRTLPLGGRCPECGNPVLDSAPSDPLCSANREWLETIKCAVSWTFLALVGPTVPAFFASITYLSPRVSRLAWLTAGITVVLGTFAWISLLSALVAEPDVPKHADRRMARWVVRALIWLWPVAALAAFLLGRQEAGLAAYVVLLVAAGSIAAIALWLRPLAVRAGRPSLAEGTVYLCVLLAIGVASVTAGVVKPILDPPRAPASGDWIGHIPSATELVTVYTIMLLLGAAYLGFLVLLGLYYMLLRKTIARIDLQARLRSDPVP